MPNINIERLAQQKTRITEVHLPPIPDVPVSLLKFPGVQEWNRQLKLMRERDQEQLYRALLNKGGGDNGDCTCVGEKGDKGDTGDQGIQGTPGSDGMDGEDGEDGADGAAGGAPSAATYIVQTPDGTLTNEQALSLLATGLLKSTTGTGAVSIAAAGTDYQIPLIAGTDYEVPLTFTGPLSRAVNAISISQANGSTDGFLDSADWATFNSKQDALPVSDATAIVKGSVTANKLLRFEVDGFTAATTRVITPPDSDITLAGTNIANTWASLQTFTSGITLPDATGIITFGSFGTMFPDSITETIAIIGATSITPSINTTIPLLITHSINAAGTGYAGLSINATWNGTGTYAGYKLNVVDTASDAASALLDLQKSSVSFFKVDRTGTVSMAVALAAIYGGTGQSAYAVGDILYANSTTTLAPLIVGISGKVLMTNGAGFGPSWETLTLSNTNTFSGILAVANGGTGAGAFTIGSVVFAGTSGVYTQDNANVFWDNTGKQLFLGGATAAAADTILGANGSAVFNEQGTTGVHFRVESDTKTHMFFVDGTNNRIGINTSAPTQMFELWGTQNTANRYLLFDDTNWIRFQFQSSHASIGTIWNLTSGKDWYFGETADTGNYIFRGRALTNEGSVGIGTTTLTAKLNVLRTTEQLRILYDASNYYSTTVGSTGTVTFDAVGAGAKFVFSDDVDHSAKNIITDTTTGTKIGSATAQKIGFWNATPIVQPTTAVAAATFVANTSLIANDTATFDSYTIGQVVKALRNCGILA